MPGRPPYVQKSIFDWENIRYVGRGRRVMHDGMQYDLILGQVQGHALLKVKNWAVFKGYLLPIYNGGSQVTKNS